MKLTDTCKIAGFAVFLFIISSCKKDAAEITGTGTVGLEFEHKVRTQALQIGTQSYVNAHGDDFKVSTFKYYISNISFQKADGSKITIPESYLLIDASDISSTLQTIADVPAGDLG